MEDEEMTQESNNNANYVQVQVRFSDLGGMEDLVLDLGAVLSPVSREFLRKLGPVTSILLRGPPGCGKTILARAIANETGYPFHQISAIELVSGVSGAPEENIKKLFAKASRKASSTAPSIVFIDDFDVIDSERIVKQLRNSMDRHSNILLIGGTNKLDFLDPALGMPGLFEKEFFLVIPDEKSREEILMAHAKKLKGSFDFKEIAKCTAGYVGSDLARVVVEAGRLLMRRIICERKRELAQDLPLYLEDQWKTPWLPNDVDKLCCTMSDFQEAVKKVQPSLVREGFFSAVHNVKLEDVGGLDHLKEMFRLDIIEAIKHPELFEQTGVGILLYVPPGCGKTLIAKAVVNAAGANFIHIKVDVLTTKHGAEGGSAGSRVLSMLSVELGELNVPPVFVIGTTTRIDVMDEACLRSGKLGVHHFVPMPDAEQRYLILEALAREKPIDPTVEFRGIAKACEGFSGADLAELMNEGQSCC